MSNLTYLNDASVLHNLKQRYYHKLIYVSWRITYPKHCVARFLFRVSSTRTSNGHDGHNQSWLTILQSFIVLFISIFHTKQKTHSIKIQQTKIESHPLT